MITVMGQQNMNIQDLTLDLYFQQTKKNLRSISLATSNQPNNIPAKHIQISWLKEYAGFLTKIIQEETKSSNKL